MSNIYIVNAVSDGKEISCEVKRDLWSEDSFSEQIKDQILEKGLAENKDKINIRNVSEI